MGLYRVTSQRLVLAPLGDEVELSDDVFAARLVAGGHLELVENDSAEQRKKRGDGPAGAVSDRDSSVSANDTDTKGTE